MSKKSVNRARELKKMMSLGHSMGAPTQLTGGAALLKESIGRVKKKLKKKKTEDIAKAIDELEEVENLAKMSRPAINFPNFTKLNSRPDQEVQTIETGRQKDLYGRKVANADYGDKQMMGKTRLSGSRKVLSTKEDLISAVGERVSNKFDRNTLGLNSSTKQGPKSAAIAGKLRSKFEEGDDEHKEKLLAHYEKRNAIVQDYNNKYQSWQRTAYDLSNKIHEPGGREAYDKHLLDRPQRPKLPRAPSKKRVATEDLSPEKQKARGQAIDSTIHHEGFHHTMAEMEQHYGKDIAAKAHKGILAQFHPDTLSSVGGFIHSKMGYKTTSPKFTEEILAHTRDILTNPKKRESYKKYAGEKADEHIKNMKVGHQKAYEYAKNLKPEDLGVQKSDHSDLKSKAVEVLKKIRK